MVSIFFQVAINSVGFKRLGTKIEIIPKLVTASVVMFTVLWD